MPRVQPKGGPKGPHIPRPEQVARYVQALQFARSVQHVREKRLQPTQMELLELLAQGLKRPEIARRLGVTPGTVTQRMQPLLLHIQRWEEGRR